MPTVTNPQDTLFTFDILGRYGCNTLEEAVNSLNRPNRRMFDFIIIGGGSFGAVLASHLLNRDRTLAHRILVLEAGPFALPEHVQNLPGNFAPPGKGNQGTVWDNRGAPTAQWVSIKAFQGSLTAWAGDRFSGAVGRRI